MSGKATFSLDGEWQLGWMDGRRGDQAERVGHQWLSAIVPGEVHRDLERLKILEPIEPGLGVLQARWVEDRTWIYRRELPKVPNITSARAELIFDRLELDAKVFVNGTLVATHRNSFRPLRVDISSVLQEHSNILRVEIDGGHNAVSELPGVGYRTTVDQGVTKRHWLRTGQSQFSWDWAPHLVTVGITGAVNLEIRTASVRIDQVVPTVTVSADHSKATLACLVHVHSVVDSEFVLTAGLSTLGGVVATSIHVGAGDSNHEVEFEVDNPPLWWPAGMGDQVLHDLSVSVSVDGNVVDKWTAPVGLRTIEVNQSDLVGGGKLFQIVVNGVPFFARGANWVPISLTPHPVDHVLLERQLDRALEANFNFLRVWGGGDYESDLFYSGCDRRGILVWQDFAFACSRYPFHDPEFRQEVIAEATFQLRRLASRPCLAIWAGNNEIAWIGSSPGWPGPLVLPEDAVTREQMQADHLFFERELAELAQREDPSHHYQPSSPWSPSSDTFNDFSEGDQHPWQVGFEDVDFLKFRDMDARFPDEGGLLGPPSLSSVLESLPPDQRAYDSFAWKVHDNQVHHSYAARPMTQLLKTWTGLEEDRLALDEYVYWTGLVQSEGLTEYIDNFRSRGDVSSAAVFWMFNDCWPTVRSWSIVDYAGRRNPAFFAVKRAFAPVRIVLRVVDGTVVAVAINDTPNTTEALFEWSAISARETPVFSRNHLILAPRSITRIELSGDFATEKDLIYVAALSDASGPLSRSHLIRGSFLSSNRGDATISVEHGKGFSRFTSDALVLGVCIDLDGERDISDNFFDLIPGRTYEVRWDGGAPPEVLFTASGSQRRPRSVSSK